VASVSFSPDAKQIAVSGLDASLSIYKASGGSAKKVEAPKNTIVRMTPDWSKLLFVRLLTDGQKIWASVQAKNPATLADLGPASRIPLRSDMAVEDVYAGNDRLILCGSIASGNSRTGFVTMADFGSGQVQTLTGGYRIGNPTSSEDNSTYAVYVEPVDLRSAGSILVLPADLTKQSKSIPTPGCNSSAGLKLSDDGDVVARTGQRILSTGGAEILGTRIFDVASGNQQYDLPKLRVAAFVGNGGRVLGWRSQIGGPIVELLDMKSGNGLGETPGGEVWLSRDEKLVAQATPEGTITLYKLNQP
jgi:WD40 repeat protein